jgi:hypothetical protein
MKLVLIRAVGVLAWAASGLAGATEPGQNKRLFGADIAVALSNADVHSAFTGGGADGAERMQADGRLIDLNGQHAPVGAWGVANDEACFVYFRAPPQVVCYAVYVSGGVLQFREAKSGKLVAKITKVVRPARSQKAPSPSPSPSDELGASGAMVPAPRE